MPYASRDALADSLASADVCLAPLGAGLTRYMLPSKLYTILACGRPFIAAIDASSDLRMLAAQEQDRELNDESGFPALVSHLRRDVLGTVGQRFHLDEALDFGAVL